MINALTGRLAAPDVAERRDLLSRLGDRAVHAEALRSLPALNAVETAGRASRTSEPAPSSLRIAAWNDERGRHPDAAAALLARTGADVVLLSEMDLGMARTDQRHTTADLADRLGAGYAFGVEFVELAAGSTADHTHGDPEGQDNDLGLHGNAVLSRRGITRPTVVRLSDDGRWFGHERGEPRVGGRMAILATVPFGPVGAGPLAVAAVHLESSSTPEERAREFTVLLDAMEEYADGAPVVIGGDLNTCSAPPAELLKPGVWEELLAEDTNRYVHPVPHEPLFAEAAARGYQWEAANARGTTTRYWSGSRRWQYALRLDWILTRGVACMEAATYPAIDGDDPDKPISDHDLLAVTVSRT